MSQSIRNEESRSEGAAVEWPQAPQSPHSLITRDVPAGVRIEENPSKTVSLPAAYGGLLKILGGRGTVCVPLASSAEIPSPQSAGCEPINTNDIQTLWNQVLADSNKQVTTQIGNQAKRSADDKTKKLERLLQAALSSGDIDTAMLLFAALESREANKLAASLMDRMHQLQQQREKLTASLSQPQKSGDEKQDAQNAQSVNAQVGDINTEMTMLQTFLQDVTERKNEAQQMASNFQKSRHDTALGIIRNMS